MSQNTAHRIAIYLADQRVSNPLGYSASEFISDAQSVLPKRAKRKIRQVQQTVERKVSGVVDSGQRKVFDFVDNSIDYKAPTASDLMSQVASESTPLSEEELQAQEDAEAQKEKDEEEASIKRARNVAIASIATVGGLVALYFVFKK